MRFSKIAHTYLGYKLSQLCSTEGIRAKLMV